MELVETRPVVLTSVVVTERTGAAPAMALITDPDVALVYLQIAVPAGSSVVWADRVALPFGLAVYSVLGSVAVTVAFE